MDKVKDDQYYIEKMKINFERIMNTIDGISYEEFLTNLDYQDITMFNLIQISENVKNISSEYKEKNSEVPWFDIYGLRNRIVHDYGNVVLDTIYKTITDDIPDLYKKFFKKK